MEFYSQIVKYYEAIFPTDPIKVEMVGHMAEALGYTTLLDVGCATGSFAGAISKFFDNVDAVDLDANMIQQAQRFYKQNSLSFQVGNMLELNQLYKHKSFDVITCFGNTLVHLSKIEVAKVLSQIKEKLNPGGTFICQILNYDYIYSKDITELPLIDHPLIRFDRHYILKSRRSLDFLTKLTIKESDEVLSNTIELFPIFHKELETMAIDAGFEKVHFIKNYKGDPYEGNHIPLIMVAR